MSDRSQALKAMTLSAEFRSCLRLMDKSKLVSGGHLKCAREDCARYLAQSILIYPPSLEVLGLKAIVTGKLRVIALRA